MPFDAKAVLHCLRHIYGLSNTAAPTLGALRYECGFYDTESQMNRATNRLADDIASTGFDRPMKLEQYNSNKRAIRTHLCAKHDAHAILVKPGSFSPEVSLRAARLRMSELSANPEVGCRLIRGYRLVSLGDSAGPTKRQGSS